MTRAEFEQKCKELCPHCKAGGKVRQRTDTNEFIHDFATGATEGSPFGRRLMGHSICHAHDFRMQNKDQISE